MTKRFEEEWNEMSIEEKNVIVSSYLKSLNSKWDFKRILCDVFGIEHYMDDDGLRKAVESIINVR